MEAWKLRTAPRDAARARRRPGRLRGGRRPAERTGFLRRARTVLGRSELVRDEDLFLACELIHACWTAAPPFGPWTCAEFRKASPSVVKQHLPLRETRRMMFSPLKPESFAARLALRVVGALATRCHLPKG